MIKAHWNVQGDSLVIRPDRSTDSQPVGFLESKLIMMEILQFADHGFVGEEIILSHKDEIRMMEDLMDILWPTHQFLVDGKPVNQRDEVLAALNNGGMISYFPFGDKD